ncbi:MAG: Fur family transcriptional regulator [Eubacterium sp.]
MKASLQDYRDKIKSVGLKATPQRIGVLKILSETEQHPSAEMLMKKLKEEGNIMSVGTIYNILETFEEKGLILKLHDHNEVMRFDAHTEFHIHIFNKETNQIEDYFDDQLENILKDYLKDKLPGHVILDHLDLSLYSETA